MKTCKKWTEAEDAILREIWETPGSIKSQLHKLPGRTWFAVKHHSASLKMPPRSKLKASTYSWVREVVDAELQKGRPMTSLQIAGLTPASHPRINQILREGHGKTYYIAGWIRSREHGDWYPKWAWGQEEDVRRPANKNKVQAMKEYRARKKLKEASQTNNPFAVLVQQVMVAEPKAKSRPLRSAYERRIKEAA